MRQRLGVDGRRIVGCGILVEGLGGIRLPELDVVDDLEVVRVVGGGVGRRLRPAGVIRGGAIRLVGRRSGLRVGGMRLIVDSVLGVGTVVRCAAGPSVVVGRGHLVGGRRGHRLGGIFALFRGLCVVEPVVSAERALDALVLDVRTSGVRVGRRPLVVVRDHGLVMVTGIGRRERIRGRVAAGRVVAERLGVLGLVLRGLATVGRVPRALAGVDDLALRRFAEVRGLVDVSLTVALGIHEPRVVGIRVLDDVGGERTEVDLGGRPAVRLLAHDVRIVHIVVGRRCVVFAIGTLVVRFEDDLVGGQLVDLDRVVGGLVSGGGGVEGGETGVVEGDLVFDHVVVEIVVVAGHGQVDVDLRDVSAEDRDAGRVEVPALVEHAVLGVLVGVRVGAVGGHCSLQTGRGRESAPSQATARGGSPAKDLPPRPAAW